MSEPAWPSTVSLPSPGFQTKVSSPAPIRATSLPRPPSMTSLPSPPISTSLPPLPVIMSLPAPPSTVSRTDARGQGRRVDGVVTSERVEDERVVSEPSVPLTATRAGRPATTKPDPAPMTLTESSPLVPLTMTVSAWPSPVPEPATPARSRLSWVRSVPVRSLTVMVSAPPRALRSIPSTPLRSMVTLPTSRKSRTRLPLAETSIFSDGVGAVEEHRVGAGLALDGVAAVAGVPDEGVVAGAHQGHVVAPAAVDDVVAVAADQHVVAVAADQRVVPRAAVHGDRGSGRRGRCRP